MCLTSNIIKTPTITNKNKYTSYGWKYQIFLIINTLKSLIPYKYTTNIV